MATDGSTGGQKMISLALYDEVPNTTSLFNFYLVNPAWWQSLDDPEDEQSYLIGYNSSADKILILGADEQGLKAGVVDFLKSMDAVDFDQTMMPNTVFLSWWHYSTRRGGDPIVGNETAMGFVEDLTAEGFDVVGAAAQDPEMTRIWAATAATGGGVGHDRPGEVIGYAHYGWGSDGEGPEYLLQGGHYAWQAEWGLLDTWHLANSADYPGGADTGEYAAPGLAFVGQGSEKKWPQIGQALSSSGAWNWYGSEALLEGEWVTPDFSYPLAYGYWTNYPDWARVLVRFYAEIPEECSINVSVEFKSPSHSDTYSALIVQDDGLGSRWVNGGRFDAYSAVVDFPGMWPVAEPLDGVLALLSGDCEGESIRLDSIAIYQGVPSVDFPYAYQESGLDQYTGTEEQDAQKDVCGTPSGTCQNSYTFPAN